MIKNVFPGLICVAFLTGCIRLLPDTSHVPTERVDLIILENTVDLVVTNAQKSLSIKVFTPTSADMLNSLRVAITRYKDDLKYMDYLADVEWKDSLLLLIQQRLMEVLSATNIFKSVSLDREKFRADLGIYSYVHKFEIEQRDGQIEALISITTTLSETHSNKIIEQKTFNVREKVGTNTIIGYLKALNQAFLKIQAQFLTWIRQNSVLNNKVEALPSHDHSEKLSVNL